MIVKVIINSGDEIITIELEVIIFKNGKGEIICKVVRNKNLHETDIEMAVKSALLLNSKLKNFKVIETEP